MYYRALHSQNQSGACVYAQVGVFVRICENNYVHSNLSIYIYDHTRIFLTEYVFWMNERFCTLQGLGLQVVK